MGDNRAGIRWDIFAIVSLEETAETREREFPREIFYSTLTSQISLNLKYQ